MTKTTYSNQLKEEVINFIKFENHTIAQASAKFGIPTTTIEKWITQFNADNKTSAPLTKEQALYIIQLEEKLANLEEENSILKDAMSLMSKKKI